MRPSEWLLLAYFSYAASFSAYASADPGAWIWRSGLALAVGCVVFPLSYAESRTGARLFSIIRDWLPAPLILIAYWAVDWFERPVHGYSLENAWIPLDRFILNHWAGKAAIEVAGPVLPFFLELCYSLLYAIPPVSIGILYLYRRRDRVDRFVFTLLLGTLITYVLLPYFPSISPRVVFPGEYLPAFSTPFRSLNLWLLDNFDIRASVFPSGHVTVGLSAAFGMLLAFPERRRVGWAIAAVATAVAIATVYGRYHYAVDSLAGVAVSLLACGASALLYPKLRRATLRKRDA